MATTWQEPFTSWLGTSFDASIRENLNYRFKRDGSSLTYSLQFADRAPLSLPVRALVGGRRHGLGFLIPIKEVDGIPLARPALVQARYAWSPEQKKLLIAPGSPSGVPQSLEAALGLPLSPTFEERCLSCHGEPRAGAAKTGGGVQCESCHGPGSEHLAALGRKDSKAGIVNPKFLSNEDSIGVCSGCHTGLTRFADPSGDDLLIANQARAITSSECYVQSRKGFSCVTCHDPHSDAIDDTKAVAACLGCHSTGAASHAAICPVNAKTGCTGCHMPGVEMGPLHLVDHLIRVHPEQKVPVKGEGGHSQVRPVSAYQRIIVSKSAADAAVAQERLRQGESFYKVAREISIDASASVGGYIGPKALPDEVAQLDYGATSGIVRNGATWMIVQRLPRDFRWQAEQLLREAEALAAGGDAAGGIERAQQALMIYPHFLRALNFIGSTFANAGNPAKGAAVLRLAAELYPQDAGTSFTLASLLAALNDPAGAREMYRRVLELEPDFTAAYISLGRLEYEAGDWQGAAATFRRGLQIDPLSAKLYEGLGLALGRAGDSAAASEANTLASKLKLATPSAGSDYFTSAR